MFQIDQANICFNLLRKRINTGVWIIQQFKNVNWIREFLKHAEIFCCANGRNPVYCKKWMMGEMVVVGSAWKERWLYHVRARASGKIRRDDIYRQNNWGIYCTDTKNLDELNQYYKITKFENDNTLLVLKLIDELFRRIEELEKRTA